jgi:hypothetical protein
MDDGDNRAFKIDHEEQGREDHGQVIEGRFGGGDPTLSAEAEKVFGAGGGAGVCEAQAPSVGSLAPAVLGGVLAALVGGTAWAVAVVVSGYEIGFAAIGIGALSGYAVVLMSKGGRGTLFQVIAALSSVLGVAVGKYVYYFYYLKEAVTEQYGLEVAANVRLFSVGVLESFIMDAGSFLGGFDILWVALAVITAWKIPSLKTLGPEK